MSGSVDHTIRIWRSERKDPFKFELVTVLRAHRSSVNCLAVRKGTVFVISGSADAKAIIWRLDVNESFIVAEHLQTIKISPSYFPLALALHTLGDSGDLVLAVAGTSSIVQIYAASKDGEFRYQATLTGHEGWVRCLAITGESHGAESDLLLASASQDKYIRLWRLKRDRNTINSEQDNAIGGFRQLLSIKAHKLKVSQNSYSLTFEALLLGHDDWIYTLSWHLGGKKLQLLSSSADNSLAIWESEESSGIWVCTTRLGEISAQKGSTTAAGSTGGFWIGLWSPSGLGLASLGRTGSWRIWSYDTDKDRWLQGIGISGHTRPVTDIAWSKDGAYLLSTGSDQTTRMHAAWVHGPQRTWHEMARPQIHGYNLNCIDSIGQTRFISGADEKLLRVFDEPRATAELLDHLCDIILGPGQTLPDIANIPVLGLSNKAIETAHDDKSAAKRDLNGVDTTDSVFEGPSHASDTEHPPFENELARYTLWPEKEKLYGHGYEISAVAASHDGTVVATSCKASSIDHAVIRLYTTEDWREVKPSLTAHSLTVTALCFSKDDHYLLGVGRDRQWTVFERDLIRPEIYLLRHSNSRGHLRMILNSCWAPLEVGRVFATAGRDKSIKFWRIGAETVESTMTITASSPVTAVDVSPQLLSGDLVAATGTETGEISLHLIDLSSWRVRDSQELDAS